MKRILIILLLLSTGRLMAQTPSAEQRKKAAESVYALYKTYMDNVNLRTIARGASDKKIVEFKGLFANGATIDDAITPADTVTWLLSGPVRRSVPEYLAAVGANFKSGLNGSIVRANISFDSLSQKLVKIIYERNENAINAKGYKFSNVDTMVLRIRLSDDYSSASIVAVQAVGGQLRCQGCAATVAEKKETIAADNTTEVKKETKKEAAQVAKVENPKPAKEEKKKEEKKEEKKTESVNSSKVRCPDDDDCDGVSNLVDKCPNEPGLAKYGGCPAPDPIWVGISINLGGGAGIPSIGSSPSTNYTSNNSATSFNSYNTAVASQPGYKTNPGGGFHAGLDIDLLFGKHKNAGVSLGVDFMQNFATSDVNNFKVVYGVSSDGAGNSYTRILTANSYSEKVTFTNVAIPILFKYQTSPDKPLGLDLEIGPVLSVLASASTTASANLNFEAAYGFNNSLNPQQTLHDGGNNPTANSSTWLITQQHVSSDVTTGVGVDQYFANLYRNGRYVGLHQSFSGSAGSVKYNFGFGGLLRIGGVYRINRSVSLLFGVYSILSYNSHSAGTYQPVNADSDFQHHPVTFQSFLNGLGSAMTTQVGVNLGIQVKFGKKEKTSSK